MKNKLNGKWKHILRVGMIAIMITSITGCSGVSSSGSSITEVETTLSDDEAIREEVKFRGDIEYAFHKIGGNECKSSSVTVSTIKKDGDTAKVSGQIYMTDIYGTKYQNTYDCTLTKSSSGWSAGSIKIVSDSWRKQN